MILRVIPLALFKVAFALPTGAAQPAFETIRIGIPGKLVDFAPFFVDIKIGIYRSQGLEPQFIVMRSGIINMIYTPQHKHEALPLLIKEFPGMERDTLEGMLDFYLRFFRLQCERIFTTKDTKSTKVGKRSLTTESTKVTK